MSKVIPIWQISYKLLALRPPIHRARKPCVETWSMNQGPMIPDIQVLLLNDATSLFGPNCYLELGLVNPHAYRIP